MKFQRIEIEAFGALSGTSIDGLEGRLNVIAGPNGAGKTTLLEFLRGLCCGFSGARKLGLLSASGGGPGGGSIDADWQGDVCRFSRTADADADNPLRVTLVRSGLQTTQPRVTGDHLPAAQIPWLYTVGHTDVCALDKLVRMALADGIDLIASSGPPDRPTAAPSEHIALRTQLDDNLRKRIDALNGQQQRLSTERQQLVAQHDERCRLAREELREELANESRRLRQRVDWYHAELQAAESDLSEAEERAWRRDDRKRLVPRSNAPLLRLRRVPTTSHIEVSRREELEDIDRRTAELRVRLGEIARARLDVNLRAARIAGSPELPTGEFLRKLRGSLGAVEDGLLELRADAERLEGVNARRECPCNEWSSATRTIIDDLRRRLYGTCESVSLYEVHHLQSQLDEEAARLDCDEQQCRNELISLAEQRERLNVATGQLAARTGQAQRAVEQELCRCSEHDEFREHRSTTQQPVAAVLGTDSGFAELNCRPTSEVLSRLRQRRHELCVELDKARGEWRHVRSHSAPITLPEDVRFLEREAARKQLELTAITQELSDAQQQLAFSASGDVTPIAAGIVEQDVRPSCVRWAAEYLARLTGGRYRDLRITADAHDVRIIDERGSDVSWQTVSRGLVAQVALSLRLALVRAYAEQGVRFPLVLDDVLVDSDSERLREAVAVLKEFADEHDQQILYLTCGMHVTSLFESVGASVRTFPTTTSPSPRQAHASESPSRWSVQGWIDRRLRRLESLAPPRGLADDSQGDGNHEAAPAGVRFDSGDSVAATSARTTAVEIREADGAPLARRQPDGPYWLTMDSSLLHVPSIGEQMGRRLSALGIRTVSDLLDLTAEESSIPLRSLQVDVGRLREWQAEALLLCCVPDLSGPDAQLLVGCGVCDPHELAECDVAQLINRLDRLSRRNRESHLGASLPTREDLQRWIHSARRSRSIDDARHAGSRSRQDRRGGIFSHRLLPQTNRATAGERPDITGPENDHAVVGCVLPLPQTSSGSDGSVALRFYLSPESPVVDAPSIGPKMASRLAKLGVVTVADLLTWEPAAVAERLKNRHVKAEAVAVWQRQARLMCRIPQLRGHDVQVLVACDITEPEQVAGMDARTLLGIVGPFSETTEGQRLLRSSKSPDLDEVKDWINWAHQARPLRAA